MAYNLEPIEESDLQLDKKFQQKKEKGPSSLEKNLERTNTNEEFVQREIHLEKERTEIAYEKTLEVAKQTSSPAKTTDGDEVDVQARDIMKKEADARVQQLVDVARNKGVTHAFKVALKMGDYYTIDRLHDELVTKFYDELVQKGNIKPG